MQNENTALSTNLKETISELESMRSKILQLEESTLQMERYSRSFNLRFRVIPEVQHDTPLYPYDKIKEIKANKCDFQPQLERAHRSGRIPNTPADKPRHILVKFLYRPERQAIME